HRRGGQRELVAGDLAQLRRAQRDEFGLDQVGLGEAARRKLRRQLRETLAFCVCIEQPFGSFLHGSPRKRRALPASSLARAASPSPCMSRNSLPTRSSPSGNG